MTQLVLFLLLTRMIKTRGKRIDELRQWWISWIFQICYPIHNLHGRHDRGSKKSHKLEIVLQTAEIVIHYPCQKWQKKGHFFLLRNGMRTIQKSKPVARWNNGSKRRGIYWLNNKHKANKDQATKAPLSHWVRHSLGSSQLKYFKWLLLHFRTQEWADCVESIPTSKPDEQNGIKTSLTCEEWADWLD